MKHKRLIVTFLICFLLLIRAIFSIVYITFILSPTIREVTIFRLMFPESKYPQMYQVATEKIIHDPPISPEFFSEISCYDYHFNVPWKNQSMFIDTVYQKAYKNDNGDGVIVIDQRDNSLLQIVKGGWDEASEKKFIKYFGNKPLKSDYEYRKFYYTVGFHQISLLSSYKEAHNKLLAVTLKAIDQTPKYYFETNNIQGFQFGSIDSKRQTLCLDIFDKYDNNIKIVFLGKSMTQENINYIISTIESTNTKSMYNKKQAEETGELFEAIYG